MIESHCNLERRRCKNEAAGILQNLGSVLFRRTQKVSKIYGFYVDKVNGSMLDLWKKLRSLGRCFSIIIMEKIALHFHTAQFEWGIGGYMDV